MLIDNRTSIPTKLISEIIQQVAELEHVRVENVPVYVRNAKYLRFSGVAYTNRIARECHHHGMYVDAGYMRLKVPAVTVVHLADYVDKKVYPNHILDGSKHPVYLAGLIFLLAHEFSHIKDAQHCLDIPREHYRMRHDNRPHEIEANRRAQAVTLTLLERKDIVDRWQGYLRAAYYDSL
jgi:hypothetical protein